MTRLALAIVILSGAGAALAHNAGIDNRWLDQLKQPNGISCCSGHDCFTTAARVGKNGWEAKNQAGQWVEIPESIIIRDKGNPTGEPVLCFNQGRPLCFVEGLAS